MRVSVGYTLLREGILGLLIFLPQGEWENLRRLGFESHISAANESSYNGVEFMENVSILTSYGWLIPFLGSWTIWWISPLRVWLARSSGGVSLDLFIQVPLLDKALYFLLMLVALLRLMSINLMELAPIVRIWPQDMRFRRWKHREVMHM